MCKYNIYQLRWWQFTTHTCSTFWVFVTSFWKLDSFSSKHTHIVDTFVLFDVKFKIFSMSWNLSTFWVIQVFENGSYYCTFVVSNIQTNGNRYRDHSLPSKTYNETLPKFLFRSVHGSKLLYELHLSKCKASLDNSWVKLSSKWFLRYSWVNFTWMYLSGLMDIWSYEINFVSGLCLKQFGYVNLVYEGLLSNFFLRHKLT